MNKRNSKPETIVCASLKYNDLVVPCIRHFDNIAVSILDALNVPNDVVIEQGFLTSHRRFLLRKEAKKFSIETGQLLDNGDKELFSEELY